MNDYQKLAMRTHNEDFTSLLVGNTNAKALIYALGLVGEAGEVAELFKKAAGHGHPLVKQAIEKELGDVLWYVAGLCHLTGLDFDEVCRANIRKLNARYPDGFSASASMNRTDE